MKLKFIIGVVGILSACGFTNAPSLDTTQEEQDNNWVIGPFHRPEGVNPVISPQPTEFYCPMRKKVIHLIRLLLQKTEKLLYFTAQKIIRLKA